MTSYNDAASQASPKDPPSDYGPLESYFVIPETPCPYLPGRLERKIVTQLSGPDALGRYDVLSRAGFRRSHVFAYRPACRNCSGCVSVRVRAKDYEPSQTLRRINRRNGDLVFRLRPAVATEEQFTLFQRYLAARHHGGEMAEMTASDFRQMVDESAVRTQMAEFRLPEGTLVAACLVDWLDDGASAVYSFFEPAMARRSLGTAVIDRLIRETAAQGRNFFYLGYWIAGARKMAYKTRFRPLEGYVEGAWKPLDP